MLKDSRLEMLEKYLLKKDIGGDDAQYLWNLYHEYNDVSRAQVSREVKNLAPNGWRDALKRNFTKEGRNSIEHIAYQIAISVQSRKEYEDWRKDDLLESIEISEELGVSV